MNQIEPFDPQNVTEVERAIRTALNGIRDGSIEILVHVSKVVQIERKERVRFALNRFRSPR